MPPGQMGWGAVCACVYTRTDGVGRGCVRVCAQANFVKLKSKNCVNLYSILQVWRIEFSEVKMEIFHAFLGR